MSFNSKLQSEDVDLLFEGILKLKDKEECYRFFEDLCTIKELESMTQRFKVARMLYSETTYEEIMNETSASTATISRINRSLQYGAEGYKLILKRMEE